MDKKNWNKTFNGQAFDIIDQLSIITDYCFGQTNKLVLWFLMLWLKIGSTLIFLSIHYKHCVPDTMYWGGNYKRFAYADLFVVSQQHICLSLKSCIA